jgi:hypothetical protein
MSSLLFPDLESDAEDYRMTSRSASAGKGLLQAFDEEEVGEEAPDGGNP